MSLLLLVTATGDTEVVDVDDAKIDAYLAGTLAAGPSAYYRMADMPTVPSEISSALRWRPPEISAGASVVAVQQSGGSPLTFGEDEDVILVFPTSARTVPLRVVGGRNIRVIGGAITLSAPSSGEPSLLRFQDVKGSVYLEGLNLDGGGQTINGLTAGGTSTSDPTTWQKFPDVFIQNCRITNIHAGSIIQVDYPMENLFIDKFTGTSDTYGILLAPAKTIKTAYLSRINLSPLAGGSATPLLLHVLETDDFNPSGPRALVPFPIYMVNVNVELGVGLDYDADWLSPAAGKVANGIDVGLRINTAGVGSWPITMKAYGDVDPGDHADFVDNSLAGTSYSQAPYVNLTLDAVVGIDGSYALSGKHSFNVDGAIYENSGGHSFGVKTGVVLTVKLRDSQDAIISSESVNNPTILDTKLLGPTGIAAPPAQVPTPDIEGGASTPVTTGLALSRGPTGSHWGPDSNPTTGRWTRSEWTYGNTMTTGGSTNPVNQWAHAPDFYDFAAAINQKFVNLPSSMIPVALDRAQEIGIRHIRIGLSGPAIDSRSYAGGPVEITYQAVAQARARNQTRNKETTQAINYLVGTFEPPINLANSYGPTYLWQWQNFVRPLNGPPGTAVAPFSASNPPGTYFDIRWTNIGALQGQNEPNLGFQLNGGAPNGSVRWIYEQWQLEKAAHPDTTILGGEEYVDHNTGRLAPGPAKAPQLPVFGWGGVGPDSLSFSRNIGDFTTGTNKSIDAGAPHPYQGGAPPWMIRIWGNWGVNGSNEFNGYESYNGSAPSVAGLAAGPGRFVKTIPLVVTEIGYTQDSRQAQWCPPVVAGEYLVRQMIQFYIGGMKRVYWYKLTDEGTGQPMMGVCETDGTRRASFYAFKNLLRIVGFKERPGTSTPLGMTIVSTTTGTSTGNGWVPGPNNPFRTNLSGGLDAGFTAADPDRLEKLEIIRPNDEYLVFIHRSRTLWQRNIAVAEPVTDPKVTTWQLPPGNWTVTVAEPANTVLGSPNDGITYPGQTAPGDAVNPDPVTGVSPFTSGVAGLDQLTPDSNNRIKVLVAGVTRVLKVVPAAGAPPNPTITSPTAGATVTTTTPSFFGTARNNSGDDTSIGVVVYTGSGVNASGRPTGTPVGLMSVPRTGTTWGPATQGVALADGTYTAQAQQVNGSQTGYSPAITFTIQGLTQTPLDSALFVPYSTT